MGMMTLLWPLKPARDRVGASKMKKVKLTFRAAVDQRLDALRIVAVDETDDRRIDPTPGGDRVEAADDQVEAGVVLVVLVLDLAKVAARRFESSSTPTAKERLDGRGDLAAWDARHDELRRDGGLWLADVRLPILCQDALQGEEVSSRRTGRGTGG